MNQLKSRISIALIAVFCMMTVFGNVYTSAEVKNAVQTKKQDVKKPTPASKADATVEEGKIYNSFIVDAKWLSQNLNNKKVLVLDARGPEAYAKGHIKGAIAVKWQWFADVNGKPGDKNWGLPLEAKALSKRFAEYGVDRTKTIVVYADSMNGWGEDGRIVWMLRMLGLSNAKMLNGGIAYWTSKKYETTTNESKPVPTAFSMLKMDYSLMATTDWLNSNLSKVKILDTRSKEEYEGATKYGEARGGHLPKAINLTFTKVFNADGTFKSVSQLKKLFADLGLKKSDTVITYCTAGIRSAHMSLALKMAGYNKSANFASSFYGWAGDSSLNIEK